MFNWFRKLWQAIVPETTIQPPTPTKKIKPTVEPATKPVQELPASTASTPAQDPVLVRGKLWKDTHETRWKIETEQEMSGEATVDGLIKQLGCINRAETRCSAANRLGQMGAAAIPAIPFLLISCTDVDTTVRKTSQQALAAIDPKWPQNAEACKAFPELVQKMGNRNTDVSRAAFELLHKIGQPAVPDMVNLLENKEDKVEKLKAIQLLTQIGPQAASAVPGLILALGSQHPQLRISAAKALTNIGAPAEAAVPALAVGLKDSLADGRKAMAACLASLGAASEPAIPALLPLLADKDQTVRKAAADTLRHIGQATIPALIEIVQARDLQRLDTWFKSIDRISHLYTRPKVDGMIIDYQEAWANRSWEAYDIILELESFEAAQETALLILGFFGPASSAAVPAITKALADLSPRIQLTAIQVLGQIGPEAKAAMPDLFQILMHGDESFQKAVTEALEKIDVNWMSDPASLNLSQQSGSIFGRRT